METTHTPTNRPAGGRALVKRGTTLIELLVVIVVLLIGIFGVIQVFPGGFGVLKTTRGNTMATEFSRAEIERLKGYKHQLPEEIRYVTYSFVGSTVVSIVADTSRRTDDLLPAGEGMTAQGSVIIGGQAIGYWPYVSGANLARRVIGEGGPVPAPRLVGGQYGGLLVLQFAPIVYNPANPILLQVYGNDLVRREGNPGFGRTRPWVYYLEDSGTANPILYLPKDPAKPRTFRLQITAWYSTPGQEVREIETQISVPAGNGYEPIDLGADPAVGGLGPLVGVEWGSCRVARLFDQVANSASFSNDPYEFVLLDSNLGVLLFNPAGYDYMEMRRGGRRLPLVARVNYDVFDWRILRDEFRIPDLQPFQSQLKIGSIRVKNDTGQDSLIYNGMAVPVPNGAGGFQNVEVILLDVTSGGVYLYDPTNPPDPSPEPGVVNDYLMVDPARSSYAVDKSTGFIRFRDYDRTAPGLQLRLIYPGDVAPTTVNADGRVVRALYHANGEWAVQVLKSPSLFRLTYGGPQLAEYYVGGSGVPGGSPTRIYFPVNDGGKNVTIGEIWYTTPAGLQVLNDQNFTIQTAPFDPLGPYVELLNVDPTALGFDYSNGYAVRHVRGASVIVRTLWNSAFFFLSPNTTDNWDKFVLWSRNWHRTSVETYLQRGEY